MLKIREDETSYQGMSDLGEHVYFRRLKGSEIDTFSDVLFGAEKLDDIATLLGQFIEATGGLASGSILLTDISSSQCENSLVVSRYDTLKVLFEKVFAAKSVVCTIALLKINLGQYDALFEISDTKN